MRKNKLTKAFGIKSGKILIPWAYPVKSHAKLRCVFKSDKIVKVIITEFNPNKRIVLKPCPFCGSKSEEYDTVDAGGKMTYWIHCSAKSSKICSVMPYTRYWDCENKDKAIKAWNRRTPTNNTQELS